MNIHPTCPRFLDPDEGFNHEHLLRMRRIIEQRKAPSYRLARVDLEAACPIADAKDGHATPVCKSFRV